MSKTITEDEIQHARSMYRDGMNISVISFGIGHARKTWMPHMTDEDKQIHNDYYKKSKDCYRSIGKVI